MKPIAILKDNRPISESSIIFTGISHSVYCFIIGEGMVSVYSGQIGGFSIFSNIDESGLKIIG